MENIKVTPMMQQFNEFKKNYPDAFLFFRCGDFYELFGADAVKAAPIMDITLTKRQETQMCGVPYHALDFYLNKMVKAGKKVAICEQVEDPKTSKGIVKRAITQIVTPGNLVDEKLISSFQNNFLLSLNRTGLFYEMSYADVSTGELFYQEFHSDDIVTLFSEIQKVGPREIILPDSIWTDDKVLRDFIDSNRTILISHIPDWIFSDSTTINTLKAHFNISDISEIVNVPINTTFSTPSVVLKYLIEYNQSDIKHISSIRIKNYLDEMMLDSNTVKSLEILKNSYSNTEENTLFEMLNKTRTNMGKRLLRNWVINPLVNIEKINKRASIVDCFFKSPALIRAVTTLLNRVSDIERLITRVVMNRANPRDVVNIKNSFIAGRELMALLNEKEIFKEYVDSLEPLDRLIDIIDEKLLDEAPVNFGDSDVLKHGVNNELDELRSMTRDIKGYINQLEQTEKDKLKLPTLKIKYNKILGYFFEVSRLQSVNIGDQYILTQSLVNVSRYTTKELSEIDSKILVARDRINEIEKTVFYLIADHLKLDCLIIQNWSKFIAFIDVLCAFALSAAEYGFVRPIIEQSTAITIKNGRHPVVEKNMVNEQFIPNNLSLSHDGKYINIITGPNMSGKSTFLRQNALIILMSQIGSFVPADEARVGIVDRIFSRIGTGDNLTKGESTFFVEMAETAYILKNATDRSFIIMDEIGRGTSTYDGMAIAQSIIEYIADKKVIGAKTLFATHYHELTSMEKPENGITNKSVSVIEDNGRVVFLHKIVDKPAERSYGIYVAKIADIPQQVIDKSQLILSFLESNKGESIQQISHTPENLVQSNASGKEVSISGYLFDLPDLEKTANTKDDCAKNDYTKGDCTKDVNSIENTVISKILKSDINNMTPIQAFNLLSDLQKKLLKTSRGR